MGVGGEMNANITIKECGMIQVQVLCVTQSFNHCRPHSYNA